MKQIVMVGALFSLVACGGGQRQQQVNTAPTPGGQVVSLPSWMATPPQGPNVMYQSAQAQSRDMQMAMSMATAEARAGLARQMELKVEALTQSMASSMSTSSDAEIQRAFQESAKQIASQTLTGSRVSQQEVRTDGVLYTAYVLVEMPTGAANQALLRRAQREEAQYTRFRASQAWEQLDREVKAYEEAQRRNNP